MKKYAILALAALMVVAFAIPATALENEFGGYFDTRFESRNNYDGTDSTDDHEQRVVQRTRLYYTAKINDNLKLVNKFEMDATWGANGVSRGGSSPGNKGYGVVGADGANLEIKNTYIDFNTGPVNWTVGTQGYNLWRGYYIADDASGVIARWKIADNFILAGSWLKVLEGGQGNDNDDVDSYTVTGAFWFSENMSLKPSLNYATSSDGTSYLGAPNAEDFYNLSYGADFDMTFDNWGLWVTAIGQTGEINVVSGTGSDLDTEGYLFAVGGNLMLGAVELYAEGAYSSGDDDPTDNDIEQYTAPFGAHGWAELLSDGSLWNGVPAGRASVGDTYDQLGNLIYVGGGVKFMPMDKLSINPSVWYAMLDEDNQTGESDIGTEVDLKITYELVEGLNLDLIGAYLFAGDAFSNTTAKNDDDAYEYGARLSLSF